MILFGYLFLFGKELPAIFGQIVHEITCQPFILDNSVHVSVRPDLNKYDVNTRVMLSCIPGYFGPDAYPLCQANGQWSSQLTPKCRLSEITCPPFTLDTNAHVSIQPDLNKYVVNTRVTLSCIYGYIGADIAALCLANSQWSNHQTPRCTPVPCPALNNTKNMNSPIKISGYYIGNNITIQCVEGYKLSGPPFLKCLSKRNQSMGYWSDQQPLCSAVTCHALRQVPHQKLEPVQIKYSYRDNVTFKCNDGYELTTEYTRTTCQSDGTWNNKQPDCTGVPCSHLPKIDKALLPNQTKEYRYPEVLNITCETGYVIESTDLLQCNSSGFWNSIPRCTCIENSQSYKDSMENRGKCISHGLFGGIVAAIVSISAELQIATCFYYRKRVGKPATVYEEMQFNTVARQRSSNEETYSELT